MELTRCR